MDGGYSIFSLSSPTSWTTRSESSSESEEGPDLQEPRNLFENALQFLLEEAQQDGDEDDDPPALLDGGEDNMAESEEGPDLREPRNLFENAPTDLARRGAARWRRRR
jgi:hypothetical protein